MATSMPSREEAPDGAKHFAERKRVVVFIPIDTSYLLDLVSRYQCRTKKDLHERIFRLGFKQMFGVDLDDVMPARPLPRGTAAPADPKKLLEALVGA